MGSYLYEMHLHTSAISACAHVPADIVCAEYKKAGYSGIVVTNHVNAGSLKCISESGKFIPEVYAEEYRSVKSFETPDFTVLLGMELHLREKSNEYLLYGLTEDMLLSEIPPNIMEFNLKKLRQLCDKLGILMFQAHPFRNGMTIVSPDLLDGIEIHNGNPRHDSRNDIAKMWAKKYNMRASSGSDYHELCDISRGGVVFESRITDERQLAEAMRIGSYRCKTDD